MEELIRLFEQQYGEHPVETTSIAGAGSNRGYYRMKHSDGTSVIGVKGTSREENHAFIYLARHFGELNLPVPAVIAVNKDEMCYLQQDLGSVSLFDALRPGREAGGQYSEKEQKLLVETIKQLPRLQICGARGMDWDNCYPQPEFNEVNVMLDLNYFKYCFLKPSGLDFHELKLEEDFHLFAKDLLEEPVDSFMYRDFQARNVMLVDGHPAFIDFQGGRKGPYFYDLASFLWQASAKYSGELRRKLTREYYDTLKEYIEVPSERHFTERLSFFVLFRTLQVLGAYGFRGYFERKQHFINSIPYAIENLRKLLDNKSFPYPYLTSVLRQLVQLPACKFDDQGRDDKNIETHPQQQYGPASISKYDGKGPLVVRIYSFSYRKGIPEDTSGNGGGYVFDCRSTHNPGRYVRYKQLNGLDAPVVQFLEEDGEILTFLESVYKLADAHVARYIQRGFTSLMFAFGCTGGQHRSVYSAQHLAEHIHKKFGIEVRVCHREQGITQTFNANT